MRKIIVFIIIAIIIVNCERKKNEVGTNDKKVEMNCTKEFLGINLNKISSQYLLRLLKEKNAQYKIYYYEDFPKVPNIVTKYFIGSGIRRDKIKRVMYSFSPFTGKPDVEIELDGNYMEELINVLKREYGEPTEQDRKKGKLYILWRCSKDSSISAEFMRVRESRSSHFWEGLSSDLESHENMIYLLIRPKDYGCDHVH